MVQKVMYSDIESNRTQGEGAALLVNDIKRAINELIDGGAGGAAIPEPTVIEINNTDVFSLTLGDYSVNRTSVWNSLINKPPVDNIKAIIHVRHTTIDENTYEIFRVIKDVTNNEMWVQSRGEGPAINSAWVKLIKGDDSRLSDSREWVADIVPQAEAEGGIAITARKWTAQRVFQAISSWVSNNLGSAAVGDVVQSTGNSTTDVMSQKAVTDELDAKLNTDKVVQATGSSTTDVMSQKAVTDAIQRPFTIAVIGDSMTTENALINDSWPNLLERWLNQASPVKYKVYNFSENGQDSKKALLPNSYGAMSSADALISVKPDLVLIGMDTNDIANTSVTNTAAQAISDITALVNTIRAGLPNVVMVKIQQVWHDTTHLPAASFSSALNRHVCRNWWAAGTGVFAGCYGHQTKNVGLSTAVKNKLTATKTFQDAMPAIFDHTLVMDFYRIARLGGIGVDKLHFNKLGRTFAMSYAAKGLRNAGLIPSSRWSWALQDPDDVFTAFLQSSSGEWVPVIPANPVCEHLSKDYGVRSTELIQWMNSYRPDITITNAGFKIPNTFQTFTINIADAEPSKNAQITHAASGVTPTSPFAGTYITNSKGSLNISIGVPLFPSSYNADMHFKIGTEIYGPHPFNIEA